jgi:DNA-binding MarR family transcriptional regulator
MQSQTRSFDDGEIPEADLDDLLGQLRDLSLKLSSALRPEAAGTCDGEVVYALVKDILRFRRLRNKLLGDDLFGEPAWDILLELFAADWSGEKLSVSGACYASGVPASTGLRWVVRLENEGWIQRIEDSRDKRRSWLMLTDRAHKTISAFLAKMAVSFAQAPQFQIV